MPFTVSIDDARRQFPDFDFVAALTPSAQKAAFHVRDQQGTDLCLKLISPDYSSDRLNREIHAMQEIAHPNVVRLLEYTYSTTPGSTKHYLLEEFIAGSDLTSHLLTPWTTQKAAQVFAKLLDGLSAIHAKNIVHRDIKPGNIRMRVDETPVLIDLGLCRHLELSDLTATADGAAVGTPAYFSPEQFTGNKRHIDARTDLFAIGILLYQALTGEHPFMRATLPELQAAVCHGDGHLTRPSFNSLGREWQLLIRRLLERERSRRPHSASQVGDLLRKIGGVT
jgi:serine/threonine protein kinase